MIGGYITNWRHGPPTTGAKLQIVGVGDPASESVLKARGADGKMR